MSNPFLEPGSLLVERERQRRHRFQVGVYAVLGGLLCMLMGLLIQGCQTARPKTVTPLDSTPAASASPSTTATLAATNEPPAAAPLPETNAAPASVATPSKPAQEPSAKASPSGSPATPAASAVPSAPTAQAVPSQPTQAAPTKPAASETTYVVKPGDSLSRIAQAHGTTVAALKAANGLKSDKIVVGKKLKIPSKGTTSQQ